MSLIWIFIADESVHKAYEADLSQHVGSPSCWCVSKCFNMEVLELGGSSMVDSWRFGALICSATPKVMHCVNQSNTG